jgi:DNA-directed RNA polymerase specialized sigma24 family protein
MQIDAPQTRRALKRLVARLTPQRLWHEDLVQEALIHLWQEEQRCPGRSACCYLRSCQFHVLNQMRHGRSIDSPKWRNGQVILLDALAEDEGWTDLLADPTAGALVRESVMEHDLICALCLRLRPRGREVLACLAEGLGTRETARRLRLSHTAVAKQRRQIAAVLQELEAHCRSGAPENGAGEAQEETARRR